MGRLGDLADILTLGIVAAGGYLAYRAWKGIEFKLPEVYEIDLGGRILPDIRLPSPIVPKWFQEEAVPLEPGVPWWEMRERRMDPIGIPGPALRDPSIPSIVDRIADVIDVGFTPLPLPPAFELGEAPIGIPGPAMRDRDRPSIVDRIREIVVEPEQTAVWGARRQVTR